VLILKFSSVSHWFNISHSEYASKGIFYLIKCIRWSASLECQIFFEGLLPIGTPRWDFDEFVENINEIHIFLRIRSKSKHVSIGDLMNSESDRFQSWPLYLNPERLKTEKVFNWHISYLFTFLQLTIEEHLLFILFRIFSWCHLPLPQLVKIFNKI